MTSDRVLVADRFWSAGPPPRCWLIAALIFVAGCRPPVTPEYLTLKGVAMGTTWSVQLESKGERHEAQQLRELINLTLEAHEERLSTWREHSLVSRFNRASTNWFQGDVHVLNVLQAAQTVSRASGGAFDVTVHRLIQLWGFGSGKPSAQAPPAAVMQTAMASVGFEKLEIEREQFAFRKLHPDTQIDLSALAKGYVVDDLSQILREQNYTNHLVEIGGEMRGLGLSSKGRPWRVGLELPVIGESRVGAVANLANQSLATSGDYRNFIELDGQRYAHIIDPRTGFPIEQRGIAVSVLAPTCMEADAWATALTVLGMEAGLKVAETNRLAVHFSRFEGDELRQRSSSQWPKHP